MRIQEWSPAVRPELTLHKGVDLSMQFDVRHELRTFATYFVIALTAEVSGFIGWVNEMERGGDMFQVSAAFSAHELSRLPMWLLVFVSLSLGRLLIVFMIHRFEAKRVKQS